MEMFSSQWKLPAGADELQKPSRTQLTNSLE